MQIFWKNAWISSLLLIFLSDPSSESEQLSGNRKLRGFLTELRRLSLSGISFSELRGCVLLYQFFILLGENLSVPTETAAPQKQAIPHRYTAR